MEAILTLFILFCIVWAIYAFIQSVKKIVKAKREVTELRKKLDKDTEKILLKAMYDIKRAEIYTLLNDMNMDYLMGLEDYEIEEILNEDGIENVKKAIYFYMDKDPITVEKFNENITFVVGNILRYSVISAERRDEILETVDAALFFTDDELVQTVVEQFAQDLPDDMAFLRGRINYTLAALGRL